MTGDDLAERLFAEQGYFVASLQLRPEIGQIVKPLDYPPGAKIPLRIVAESTLEEWLSQCERARSFGWEYSPEDRWFPNFYRVEAAD